MGEQTSTSPAAIEAEIVETRARLASTIDELAIRAQPKAVSYTHLTLPTNREV